jgi:hypothetical protein
MNALRLMKIASMGCVAVFLLAGAAHADGIIDYCEEVDQNVSSTTREMADASGDLLECVEELDDCMHGFGLFNDPDRCIRGYARCIRFGKRDQKQACQAFLHEWGNDTRRGLRGRDGDDLEDFLHGDSAARDACLDPALFLAEVCADQLFDGD